MAVLSILKRRQLINEKNYFYGEIAKLANDIEADPNNRFSHMNIRMQAHSFYDNQFDGAYLWDGVENNMPALDHLWGEAFTTLIQYAF